MQPSVSIFTKGSALPGPLVESCGAEDSAESGSWIVVESDEDALRAARNATSRMVDLFVSRWGLTDVHAYILCSVAMNLRLSQVVNEPMITVTAAIRKSILPQRRLF